MPREPSALRVFLEQRIELQRPVRLLMAILVGSGGSAFLILGIALAAQAAQASHPIGTFVLALCTAALGLGMLWFGLRLLRHRSASAALLGSVARRRISLVVGLLAAGMLAYGLQFRSPWLLLATAGLVAFSYYLFPLEQ